MAALRDPDTTLGPFRERDTVIVTAIVQDNLGVAIPGASLESIVYTLYSEHGAQAIINSRDATDASLLVSVNGVLTIELTQDDMAIVSGKLTENHRLLIEWIYDTDKRGSWEIRIIVSNEAKVP